MQDEFKQQVPRSPGANIHWEQVENALMRYQRAVKASKAPHGSQDGLAKARTDMGDAYAYADQTVNAARQFKRAIKTNPKRAEPHFSLAELYRKCGKTRAALIEYGKALALAPENAYYHYRMGDALNEGGYLSQALKELESAVELAPLDGFYHFWYSELCLSSGELNKAIIEMQQASLFSPRDAYYNFRLSVLYVLCNRWHDAVTALELALILEPTNNLYCCLLADIMIETGNLDRGMRLYQKAGNLDYYDTNLLQRIRQLTGINVEPGCEN